MKRFKNVDPTKKPQSFFAFLKWKLTSKKPKWPLSIPLISEDIPPSQVDGNDIRVSFVGQATFLIQTASLNILTDPIWSARSSPFKNYGPTRVTDPGIRFENLPKIDLILISHNHYDHMDIETLKKLWHQDQPKIIVPLENEHVLHKEIPGINVTTLDWHTFKKINEQINIYLEPAQHWSRRTFTDKNRALWGTFIIGTPHHSICFIGDSGYDPTLFKAIGKKFNNIILSIIPIGAHEPRWFMKNVHMNPEEAVFVHLDLNSKYSIGSHFETFPLADDEYKQAALELAIAKNKHKISDDIFITPRIGEVHWFKN